MLNCQQKLFNVSTFISIIFATESATDVRSRWDFFELNDFVHK